MTDRDSRTRSRARTPGVVVKPLHGGARSGPRPGSERATDVTTKCTKDGCKPGVTTRMSGADLSEVMFGKAPSESQPSSRTEGKPAVRNERGDRGNVGIMRSPLRASILPARAGGVINRSGCRAIVPCVARRQPRSRKALIRQQNCTSAPRRPRCDGHHVNAHSAPVAGPALNRRAAPSDNHEKGNEPV